jgi:hypothetical protein
MEYARDIWHIGPYEKPAQAAKTANRNHAAAAVASPVLNGEAIPVAELKQEH